MLHIINKSPFENSAFDSCLRVADGGDIVLIEDAVYAATTGAASAKLVSEALKRFKIHVLQPDMEARGIADRVIDGITKIYYGGFVDLVVRNKNCQSWL